MYKLMFGIVKITNLFALKRKENAFKNLRASEACLTLSGIHHLKKLSFWR